MKSFLLKNNGIKDGVRLAVSPSGFYNTGVDRSIGVDKNRVHIFISILPGERKKKMFSQVTRSIFPIFILLTTDIFSQRFTTDNVRVNYEIYRSSAAEIG